MEQHDPSRPRRPGFAPTSFRNSQFVPQLEATGGASRLHISRLGEAGGEGGGAQTVEDFVAAETRRGNEQKEQSGATDVMEGARTESGTGRAQFQTEVRFTSCTVRASASTRYFFSPLHIWHPHLSLIPLFPSLPPPLTRCWL